MRWHISAFIHAIVAALMVGCAAAPRQTKGQLAKELDQIGGAVNYVALEEKDFKAALITGGILAGKEPYSVARWRDLAAEQFSSGSISLLVAEHESTKPDALLAVSGKRGQTRLAAAFSAHFSILKEILGRELPTLNIIFRLVPSGVNYRFETRNLLADYRVLPIELIAVIPHNGELNEVWLDAIARKAVHETMHVLRFDPARFPNKISPYENEAQAYAMEFCTTYMVKDYLPDSVFSFPKSLEDAVGDQRDVTLAELFRELKDHHEPATISGFNILALAFHRYNVHLKKNGLMPQARDAMPFCRAVAHDKIKWADGTADLQIEDLAVKLVADARVANASHNK